jgi:hypothetical protein
MVPVLFRDMVPPSGSSDLFRPQKPSQCYSGARRVSELLFGPGALAAMLTDAEAMADEISLSAMVANFAEGIEAPRT